MSKTINVKVPTKKIISALEDSLKKRKQAIADYEKEVAEYEKHEQEVAKAIAEAVVSGKAKITEVREGYANWRNDKTKSYVLDVEVAKTFIKTKERPMNETHALNKEISEIENAVRILKMTEAQEVSTSTYAGVARYL